MRALRPGMLPSCLVGLVLLGLPARAAEPVAELEAVAQLRHDLWGETYIPAWSYLRARKEVHGDVAYGYGLDAYMGMEWSAGIDRPSDLDVYSFNVEGEQAWGRWTAGRQRAIGSLRPQTFDGVRLERRVSDALGLSLWGGEARHQDLDDLRDGVHMARLDAVVHRGVLQALAGAQVEGGQDTTLIARQDAEARVVLQHLGLVPDARGRLVIAETAIEGADPVTPELAQVELGARPVSALRTSVHAEHREAADPTNLFGEAILDTLAGGAVDSAGVGLRLSGARFATLQGTWSLSSYGPRDTEWWGHAVDLRWTPGLDNRVWRVSPGYALRSGPGGMFHAASVDGRCVLSDATTLGARAATVPYRKLGAPWQRVTTVGLDGEVRPSTWLSLAARVDVVSSPLLPLDVRGTGVLTLALQ